MLEFFPFILFISAVIAGFVFKKNKFLFIAILIYMALLIGGSRGLADEAVYITRYNDYLKHQGETEIIYTIFIGIFNLLHFSYYDWLLVNGIIYAGATGFLVNRLCPDNRNFVLACLLIFPLCMDATQLRQTLAMIVGWMAIFWLFKTKSKYLAIIGSTLLIILSACIHASTIFYLILVPVVLTKDKKGFTLGYTILLASIISILCFTPLLKQIASIFISPDKLDRVFGLGSKYTLVQQLKIIKLILLVFVLQAFPYIYIKYLRRMETTEFQDFVFKANIVMLAIIPLIFLVMDFYRIQQMMVIFNCCSVASMLVVKKRNFAIQAVTIIVSIACLYMLVLENNNIHTVFEPFINNNIYF